jgi:hypothetical protein
MQDDTTPVSGEVVEPDSSTVVVAPRAAPGREALTPLATDQVVAGMKAYQQLLPQLLDASDYQRAEGGKTFVKKSGWRKIARAFNLSVELPLGPAVVYRDGNGQPLRAEAVARAIAPNGQVQDGDGYCAVDEPRFKRQGGRHKIENDLRATATTRAKNRAISDLVGMGEVSAEEADANPDYPFGEPASDQATTRAREALALLLWEGGSFELLDPKGPEVSEVVGAISRDAQGYLPRVVARALLFAGAKAKEMTAQAAEPQDEPKPPEDEPKPEPQEEPEPEKPEGESKPDEGEPSEAEEGADAA